MDATDLVGRLQYLLPLRLGWCVVLLQMRVNHGAGWVNDAVRRRGEKCVTLEQDTRGPILRWMTP